MTAVYTAVPYGYGDRIVYGVEKLEDGKVSALHVADRLSKMSHRTACGTADALNTYGEATVLMEGLEAFVSLHRYQGDSQSHVMPNTDMTAPTTIGYKPAHGGYPG